MALRRLSSLKGPLWLNIGAASSQVRRAATAAITGLPRCVTQQHHSVYRSSPNLTAISSRRYSCSILASKEATEMPRTQEKRDNKEMKRSSTLPEKKIRKIDWESLTPEESTRLKTLQVEYNIWKSQGHKVPVEMSDDRWLRLMNYTNEEYRKRLCAYWFNLDERVLQYQETERQEEERWKQELQKPHPAGIPNTLNTYIDFDTEAVNRHFHNLAHAAVHGLPLVFDMGFERQMSSAEVIILAHQVKRAVNTMNTFSQDPVHLHFCGLVPNSKTHNALSVALPGFDQLPFTVTEDSYLEHYPKEKLVYLTAKSYNRLEDFNPDDVYIIGGIADQISWKKPLSYNKAKQQGLRTAKFPLDSYVKWKSGPTKNLPLDVCLAIMLEIKKSHDWRQAIQNVPSTKFEWL